MTWILHLLPIFALCAYVLASIAYFKALFSETDYVARWIHLLFTFGFVCHLFFKLSETFDLFEQSLLSGGIGQLNVAGMLSFVSLLVTAVYLVLVFRGKLKLLGAFVAPLAAILLLLSGVLFHFVSPEVVNRSMPVILYVHVVSSAIALSCFLLAFGVSMAILVQERFLKIKRFFSISRKLPPLSNLDKLNVNFVGFGILFLLIGMAPGAIYAVHVGIGSVAGDWRVLSSIGVLFIYSALFFCMKSYGLRGRRAAFLSAIGFVGVCIALIGSFIGGSVHVY